MLPIMSACWFFSVRGSEFCTSFLFKRGNGVCAEYIFVEEKIFCICKKYSSHTLSVSTLTPKSASRSDTKKAVVVMKSLLPEYQSSFEIHDFVYSGLILCFAI